MDETYSAWKRSVDRLWLDPRPDWRAAARLIAEIAGASEDVTVRAAASQALPILRALLGRNDRATVDVARRRIGTLRNALHGAAAPRFGRRGVTEEETPDARHRRMLGLPLHRRLAATEIHRAYKRAAKTAHPDGGGNGEAFLALAEARDALMHPDKKGG